MKKLPAALLLLISSAAVPLIALPASAQTKLTPKATASRADNCAPIGRTANGELVYSMKCDNIPPPPAPPPQAEVKAAPQPEPEVQRSGIFGLSYDRRPER
jgi:hypothetical protein